MDTKIMSKKILVVDDSVTARRLVVSHLAGLKLNVIEAGDGKDGLSKLNDHPDIGLIFTDINMPWMSGLEMIAEIKKVKEYQHIPICMLTTETGSDALTQAKDLGVNAFLVKPVQKEQLLAIVNGYLHSA
jgi:two-component system chemotaxis response regulator CheY